MSKSRKLTDTQIKDFISKNYEWDLREGILICMGNPPDSYNWDNPELGNDFPVRVLADFRTEIRSNKLTPTQVTNDAAGQYKLKRDDIISFFFKNFPADGERTHAIWTAYKNSRHPKGIKGYSALEEAMDNAFKKALLEEYKRNQKIYDANPRRLIKETLYKRIIKNHPEWADKKKKSSLRRSGAKFGVDWARKIIEQEGQ